MLSAEGIENNQFFMLPVVNDPSVFTSESKIESKLKQPCKFVKYWRNQVHLDWLQGRSALSKYPMRHEGKRMKDLVSQLTESYVCISPDDELDEDLFLERAGKIDVIKEWYRECFELDKEAYFSKDMPIDAFDFFESQALHQIIYLKDFQRETLNQEELFKIFGNLVKPWKGKIAKSLMMIIDY